MQRLATPFAAYRSRRGLNSQQRTRLSSAVNVDARCGHCLYGPARQHNGARPDTRIIMQTHTDTARAMVLEAPRTPLKLQARQIGTPGRGQVLIRMRGSSVNYHDFVSIKRIKAGLPCPRVPFSDGCGEIIAVGEGVTRLHEGDRVCPNFFPLWQGGPPKRERLSVVYGDHIDGCLQTHPCFDESSLVVPPAHLSDIEAATLGCAGLTAWRSLVVEGKITAGQTVLVQGTGGVALFAIAFAKMFGARVILTSSSDDKLERAKHLGVDHGINYRTVPDWSTRVLELTDGCGADLVLDLGGTKTLPQAIRAAAMGGFVAVIGALSGHEPPLLPAVETMVKNLTIKGVTVGSRTDFEDMCRAIGVAQYRPTVHQIFDLEDAFAAITALETQAHFGKIAIRI
jgi:NADPH:quinone reductase-like Zn-dependent oxidoreductase